MGARASTQQGFTFLGLLFAVVIIGLMLTVAGRVWQTTVKREREAQLLWVGHAYRIAIASYYAFGHRYPATLQNLLTDDRFPVPKHHLRRLYPDPMTGNADWTLLRTPDQSGIQGVASSSQAAPIKRDGFDLIDAAFKDTECYCRWQFIYVANRWAVGVSLPGPPPSTPGPQPPSGPTTAPGVPFPSNNNPLPTNPAPDSGPN